MAAPFFLFCVVRQEELHFYVGTTAGHLIRVWPTVNARLGREKAVITHVLATIQAVRARALAQMQATPLATGFFVSC